MSPNVATATRRMCDSAHTLYWFHSRWSPLLDGALECSLLSMTVLSPSNNLALTPYGTTST